MFACEMQIKSADSLWAINVIPGSDMNFGIARIAQMNEVHGT